MHSLTRQTLDLDGNVRFGPDVEALGDATASATNPDYWQEHLAPSDAHLESIGRAAQLYLPGIDPTHLSPDYAGFRPNIRPPGTGFFDFVIRHSPARRGLVDLLGFASPGLTSSLATGERVARLVRRNVWRGSVEPDAERWGM
jgi:glycine/D-amino acid oxidase-like deaminating enzyme